jgi:hypothetical protein
MPESAGAETQLRPLGSPRQRPLAWPAVTLLARALPVSSVEVIHG